MTPFNFFDRVYCIHLPTRQDRRNKIRKQFDSMDITDVQFIHAAPPPADFTVSNMRRGAQGNFGCNLSQIKAVVQAIADGAERPLFFEDDILFHDDTKLLLKQSLQELPDDWGVLYLGGHPRGPVPARQAKRVSDTVFKIQRYSFADAYSIRGDQLVNFYSYWCDHITQADAMYDFILGEFAGQNNGYSIYPSICEQEPGKSDISLVHDNKDTLVARGWATHIGPKNLTPKHKQLFDVWKKNNPGKWEASLQRQARKR